MFPVRLLPRWLVLALSLVVLAPAEGADAYKWSVQYLIDDSRTIFGHPQKVSPRQCRALAVSPDGRYLYAGYLHSFNNAGEVRRIALDVTDFDRATLAVLPGVTAQALSTDDHGRVYIAGETAVLIYDPLLAEKQLEIEAPGCRGVAAAREGSELVLYTADRENGTLSRYVLRERDGAVVEATLRGLGGNGRIQVPGVTDLRSVRVDANGNLWLAALNDNKILKLTREGKVVGAAEVHAPMDLALDDGRVLVTRSLERGLTVMDEGLNVIGNLSLPWKELELSPAGSNQHGALSGIVALRGRGFLVANEGGQTADQRSIYGRADDHTGLIMGKMYKDMFMDDNEPILRATGVAR